MPRIRDKVRLLSNRKKKPMSITPLAPQPESRNLLSLKQEVGTPTIKPWSDFLSSDREPDETKVR